MKLGGRRASDNVDDRRGNGGGKFTFGIVGTIVVGIIIWAMGGDPTTFVSEQAMQGIVSNDANYTPTAQDEEVAVFATTVLAGTEDVWSEIFKQNGRTYNPPQMVLFSGSTRSGCGNASSATGPFYCSLDKTLYIDLSFFQEMKNKLNAGGKFAYAYVIAHEVGHHVQNELGILAQVQNEQQRIGEKESNKLNIRLELQADFFAGVWAYHDNKNFKSLEDGDIENGLNAASQIGDDRLQMNAQGYTVPDSFNHGTSAQRSRWLKKGLQTGIMTEGDTFSIPFEQL